METQFYMEIVDMLCDALITVDQSGKIIVWNKRAVEMFGYTKEEIREKGLEAIIPPAYRQRHWEAYKRFVKNISVYTSYASELRELEGLRKDGGTFPLGIAHSLLKISDEEFYITAIIRDMSIPRHYQLMRDRLEHITRHDMKNKLVIITLAAKRLAGIVKTEEESQSLRYLSIIQDESKDLISLLDSTRELILLETGEYMLKTEEIEPVGFLAAKTEQMQPLAEFRQVGIEFQNRMKRPVPNLSADRLLLDRAMENLMKNAVEAEEPQGKVRVILSEDEKGTFAVEIHNRGKPIPEEVQKNLFQPYVTHGKKGGTGLGLYSAKLILEKIHGWKLSFESGPEGTVFRIGFGSSSEHKETEQEAG